MRNRVDHGRQRGRLVRVNLSSQQRPQFSHGLLTRLGHCRRQSPLRSDHLVDAPPEAVYGIFSAMVRCPRNSGHRGDEFFGMAYKEVDGPNAPTGSIGGGD